MSKSICPKCGGDSFEVVENQPSNSLYKYLFVQCKSCGCVIGVLDYYNIGTLFFKLAEKLHIKL